MGSGAAEQCDDPARRYMACPARLACAERGGGDVTLGSSAAKQRARGRGRPAHSLGRHPTPPEMRDALRADDVGGPARVVVNAATRARRQSGQHRQAAWRAPPSSPASTGWRRVER
ncbi:hypothetical protein GCM10007977_077230 [Dactylosporangium sucinum]|uniref:Uncharacterized protein n=1 Tax=Dactylosporangium sucinum TaxID=1424081 RepID=A0A917X345_9ACTN|nr:hypothetical protein GCM10007977_077230 [Dactylosporangium sucinum]